MARHGNRDNCFTASAAEPIKKKVVAKPDAAAELARRFCHALTEETAGLAPGSCSMMHDIALLPDEADELFDRVELPVSFEFAYLRLQRVASTVAVR
jgi:hypothetical protein